MQSIREIMPDDTRFCLVETRQQRAWRFVQEFAPTRALPKYRSMRRDWIDEVYLSRCEAAFFSLNPANTRQPAREEQLSVKRSGPFSRVF